MRIRDRGIRIPGSFMIGAATSSYQVEGGNVNADWWRYEGVRFPRSDSACDFWNRYRSDIALASSLGLKALRISIAWDRVEPRPGVFDDDAVDRYVDMVREIRARGMEPIVTLHHFTNPSWFSDMGGWVRDENVTYFVEFIRYMYDALKSHVKWWLTINEVNLYPMLAYLLGTFPPFMNNLEYTWRVFINLLRANDQAYEVVKSEGNNVGIVVHIMPARPASKLSIVDWGLSLGINYFLNRLIVKILSEGRLPSWLGGFEVGKVDFIGLNYYAVAKVRFNPRTLGELAPTSGLRGLTIDSGGFRWAIRLVKRAGKPVLVTENGFAVDNDEDRVRFIRDHLKVAIKEGVLGYIYWSLMDDYEWENGFSLRFGLIECDPLTKARRPRGSAYFLGNIARSGVLT